MGVIGEARMGKKYEMQDTSRSKHLINRLKDWIQCESPNDYSEIARPDVSIGSGW